MPGRGSGRDGGRITIVTLDPAAATTQRLRLEREGVRFDGRGRVDLEVWRWRPRAVRSARRVRRTSPASRLRG